MRHVLTVIALFVASGGSWGQVQGTKADSAEAQEKLQQYMDRMRSAGPMFSGALAITMKLGDEGDGGGLDAKVIQVMGKDKMLVRISDRQTGTREITAIIKGSTSGIVDDHFFSNLSQATGTPRLKVIGTESYTTVAGSTKTVFVLEGVAVNAPAAKLNAPTPKSASNVALDNDFHLWHDRTGWFDINAQVLDIKSGKDDDGKDTILVTLRRKNDNGTGLWEVTLPIETFHPNNQKEFKDMFDKMKANTKSKGKTGEQAAKGSIIGCQ